MPRKILWLEMHNAANFSFLLNHLSGISWEYLKIKFGKIMKQRSAGNPKF